MENDIELTHQFPTINDLRNAFMPFVQDGAIFVPTEHTFHLGDFAKVTLTLPESGHSFTFKGEVIWITTKSQQRHPGVGIQCNTNEGETFQKEARELINTLKENADDSNNQSETM